MASGKAGELESALGYFEKALEIEPNLAEAHSNLGSTLQGLGRLDEAEASYKQAIALQTLPTPTATWVTRSND